MRFTRLLSVKDILVDEKQSLALHFANDSAKPLAAFE